MPSSPSQTSMHLAPGRHHGEGELGLGDRILRAVAERDAGFRSGRHPGAALTS